MKKSLSALCLGAILLGFDYSPALADLKLCNNTTSAVSVAIGYKDREGWASEGWWTVKPPQKDDATGNMVPSCTTLLKGPLIARYYYVYAMDRQKGGAWGGKSMVCIKDKIFTIRGIDKCEERGFLSRGFFEVDTGEKPDWTVSLTTDKTSSLDNNSQAVPIPEPANTTITN